MSDDDCLSDLPESDSGSVIEALIFDLIDVAKDLDNPGIADLIKIAESLRFPLLS